MVTGSLWVMLTGDGYGKSLFSFFFLDISSVVGSKQAFLQYLSLKNAYRQEWEMVTGKGYGRWLRDVFAPFISLSFSFWGMVAGDGYGKSLGDGYGKSLFSFFS